MKTAGRENPNHGVAGPHNRAHGAVGQNRFRLIRGGGCEARKIPAEGRVFFLDFSLYRTSQELAQTLGESVNLVYFAARQIKLQFQRRGLRSEGQSGNNRNTLILHQRIKQSFYIRKPTKDNENLACLWLKRRIRAFAGSGLQYP